MKLKKEVGMSSDTIAVGEFLYEKTINFTKVTEYGVSMEALAGGQIAPPPEGARFDITFEGSIQGPKLNGTVSGVDYVYVRADRRFQLHIHAEITIEDGVKIAFFAEGIAFNEGEAGIFQLRENGTLSTSFPSYSWVNQLQVWGKGTVDLAKSQVNVKIYAA